MAEHARTFNDDAVQGKPKPFCETPTATAIFALADWCLNNRRMGLLIGEPGVGKTTALRHFHAKRVTAHLVTMNPTVRSLNPALAHIASHLGSYSSGRARENRTAIVSRLKNDDLHRRGRAPILLLDESQHLTDETLDTLRTIHDEADIGILLCGNRDFRTRFNNSRAGFGQVTSRIGMRLILDQPTTGDVDAICQFYGVNAEAARSVLRKVAERDGGLRKVHDTINMANSLAGDGAILSADHLKDATVMLEGRV